MARPNLDLMEWTGQVFADTPTAAAEIRIDAPPERVWGMVSDIFVMPELSSELQAVSWLVSLLAGMTAHFPKWRRGVG